LINKKIRLLPDFFIYSGQNQLVMHYLPRFQGHRYLGLRI
jgi:hypothetical protein